MPPTLSRIGEMNTASKFGSNASFVVKSTGGSFQRARPLTLRFATIRILSLCFTLMATGAIALLQLIFRRVDPSWQELARSDSFR